MLLSELLYVPICTTKLFSKDSHGTEVYIISNHNNLIILFWLLKLKKRSNHWVALEAVLRPAAAGPQGAQGCGPLITMWGAGRIDFYEFLFLLKHMIRA